ncbi:hypothetical protein PPERSA_01006 [Pseudocohnilembus persalinus]|uniref:PSP proline-rich domain-containing protein n=1 Tax=Pseudocohnilembus persalinus TaxID=266149 RepID=A0A0V0QVE9_PSEPJ|nr:hypothetical protein PPERSA_01006 [Pseudocohnilembus persalinus]|eukprot:KRX05928.1 hypothetical protein PPERSA_01006 [Pseudocohnilembus persalinus]
MSKEVEEEQLRKQKEAKLEKERIKNAQRKKIKKQKNKENKKTRQQEIEQEKAQKQKIVEQINELSKNNNNNEQETQQQEVGDQQQQNGNQFQNNHDENNNLEGNGNQNGETNHIEEEQFDDPKLVLTGQYFNELKDVFDNFEVLAERQIQKAHEREEYQKEKEEKEQRKNKKLQEKEQQQIIEEQKKESKKQLKKQRWLNVAKLKQLVKRPDLVEAWDITAPDPFLLLQLKSQRNTIQVPAHWAQKRKYLQNKRGILKPPFQLPGHIEETGIAKLRDPFNERDGLAMVRQKLKERKNPKMGKIDIDYEVLHDAFFKNATKPKLTIHGDVYFEGKEEEIKQNMYKPGKISENLRNALGMTDYSPPPWLINMQRYGPPPAYPYLKIIGLHNEGTQSLFISKDQNTSEASKQMQQPGVYAFFKADDMDDEEQNVDKSLWGQLIDDDEDMEGDQQDEYLDQSDEDSMLPDFENQIQKNQQQQKEANQKPQSQGGALDSLNPSNEDFRKKGERDDQFQYSGMANPDRPLYQVLEPTQAQQGNQGGIFQGSNTYKLPPK